MSMVTVAPTAPPAPAPERPFVAGKIGGTLLCLYVLGVAMRIDGCYHPDPNPHVDISEASPRLDEPFPDFDLADVSGARIRSSDLRGAPSVIAFVPSLDWSPPSKARVLELAGAFAGRTGVRVAIVFTAPQATPRALAFVRDHATPFYYLVDDTGLSARLGLLAEAPDKTPAARAATFVLDANGTVRLRDIRRDPRTWLAAQTIVDAVDGRLPPSLSSETLSRDSDTEKPAP
jgi:peroxiredoxin